MRAYVRIAALSLITALSATAPTEANEPPTCSGTDIVSELLAQDDTEMKQAAEAAKAIANDGAVLWKLEKPGQPASYLFGTIHSTDPRITKLSPALAKVIADVDTVAVELTKGADQDMVRLMMTNPSTFFFTEGGSLAATLSAERLKKLRTSMAGTGMPVDTLKPWMASMLLAISTCERTRMVANIPVLDGVVEARALELGKTVVGLETIELQVNAMASIPMEDQIPQLQLAIDLYPRADDLGETMKRLYLERKIGLVWTMNLALAKKAGIAEERFKSFEKSLIDTRNLRMAETGFAIMAEKPTLIAVGALHLVGKTGLVKLAREAGYTATPIE